MQLLSARRAPVLPLVFACLFFALTATAFAVGTHSISLRSGAIDTSGDASLLDGPDASLRLVQFDGPVAAEQMEALRDTARVFTYLPKNAFLVRAKDGLARADLDRMGARWAGPYLAEYKISPEVAAARSAAGLTSDSDGESDGEAMRRPILLHVVPDRDVAETVRRVEALTGVEVVGFAQRDFFSRVRLLLTEPETAAFRDALAQLPGVVWIEKEPRRALTNDTSIWVGQSGLAGGMSTPVFDAGILGAGQIVAVLDTGIDIDSCYFRDTGEMPAQNLCDSASTSVNSDHRKVIAVDFLWDQDCDGDVITATEWDSQNHGTHVAGTVAGDDLAVPGAHNGADGMAPQAKLVVQDCGYSPDNCADCPGIGACPVVDLNPIFQQAYDQGARIHTNSWGDEENDPTTGEYTAGSQDADEFMWNHKDFLLFFAAGNNGNSTGSVDSPSTAKSVVSVGSTLRGANAGNISGFSSFGPTQDGRIKPDLTAPGSGIMSAGNDGTINTDNCNDLSSSGTSMATPGAAGLGALVRQYYADGFYPTGLAVPGDAFEPSAALVKATLINSGTPMSALGDIPSDGQGWGRIQLDTALYFPGGARRLWVRDVTAGLSLRSQTEGVPTDSYSFIVEAGEPLEISLAWTDFPAAVGADTALVNDLDLEVSGPDGTFLGNVFAGGESTPGGSADRLNTVENVLVADPTPGIWTITVRGFNIPSGPQPYALVATGAGVADCAGAADVLGVSGAATVSTLTGDADVFLDNCEAATLGFVLANRGLSPATDLEVTAVSSPSHPSSVFATPNWTQPALAGCSNAEATVDLTSAEGLSQGETLVVDVEYTYDELAPATESVQLTVDATEGDLAVVASRTYDFESDLEGWTTTAGTFERDDAVGGAGGSTWYLQSSTFLDEQCDVVLSPELRLTATSTMTLSTHYEIENQSSGDWWDRANVSLLLNGAGPVVEPDGGRLYDVPDGSDNGVCGTTGEAGWAGSNATWAASTFSAAALGSAGVAGQPVQIDVRYGTDPAANDSGFRFDQVTITDLLEEVADAQPDVCSGAIFSDGFESGDTSLWSATVGAL